MVVFFIFAGFGNGLADAGWCAWTGNMVSANKVQGFLQSFYSAGATISPLIATSMITQANLPWYSWYYVMTGFAAMELVLCTAAFWHKTGARYRDETKQEKAGSTTWNAVKNKVTLMCGVFFLIYVGAEVALGGWIVTFMLRVRHAGAYASGISATGFWAGMTVGRALLGFITERWGERICITVYLSIAIGLELIFWLVPKFVSSSRLRFPNTRANVQAGRVSCCGRLSWILLRASLPWRRRHVRQTTTEAHACQCAWSSDRSGRRRRCRCAIRGWSHRPSQGRLGASAHRLVTGGRLDTHLAEPATGQEAGRIEFELDI